MHDKFSSMKNVRANIDFSQSIGRVDFRNHSGGIGGINPRPMPDPVVSGMAKLRPRMIRIFIQEFFFIEKENGGLDFTALDRFMQSVHETGADIMASICIKPKSLYPVVDETVWMPNEVKRWQYIVGEMVKRYSVENHYVTHWGVANEINIGEWGGCPYKIDAARDYFEYYKMTIEPVLKVFPTAKVGGPSYAGPWGECCNFFDGFIGLCRSEHVRLDFVSYNIYTDVPDDHVKGALDVKRVVDKYDSGIEIYVTELNIGLGSEISVEEKAYTSKRAAALGAILHELRLRAGFLGTFQYHIYDQFCDPRQFAPFYARARYMANHWNDEPHRLGLFDLDGRVRPQYFVYDMLYKMAADEVAASVEDCGDLRLLASHDARYNTLFLTNYNVESGEDLTLMVYFQNAREGLTRMTVRRVDDGMNWDDAARELIPTEDRMAYVHGDFHFSIYVPADSAVAVTFDYEG